MWLSHLDSVYKENESKVKLPLSVILFELCRVVSSKNYFTLGDDRNERM
jgi:hypothetical protein